MEEFSKKPFEDYYLNSTPFHIIDNTSVVNNAHVNIFYDSEWRNIEATHGISDEVDIEDYLKDIDDFVVELIDYRNKLRSKYASK